MDRRAFLKTSVGSGVFPLVGATRSRGATNSDAAGNLAEITESTTAAPSIQRGRYVVDQAQYDDGTHPDEPPAYETSTIDIDTETYAEITASRALVAEIRDHLAEVDRIALTDKRTVDVDSITDSDIEAAVSSISRQQTADGLRLFVDCPAGVETDQIADRVKTISRRVREERLPEQLIDTIGEIDIQPRELPTVRPEVDCMDTIGRFSDARYRSNGIAMGAAVRSETLGKIASSGFRGLRNGYGVVVTNAHTFETRFGQDPTELRGARLYQSRRPYAVGRCHAVGRTDDPGVDAAAVAIDTETYPSRYLANPGGNSYNDEPIVGTASWALLETYQAEGRPIYKQGAVTGRCEGRIEELREFSNGYRELSVDIHSDGGDSGGPYFIATDRGLLVAAIHRGVRPNDTREAIFVDSVLDSLEISFY
jgi:hypothetical protein